MPDAETFCEVGGLPAFCCAHCRGLLDVPILDLDDERGERDERQPRLGAVFYAYWPGKCTGCGTKFGPGEPVQSDGYGGYVLVECCGGGAR